MKKASVLLSSALVLGTLLAGCGNDKNDSNAAATNAPAAATEAPAAEATAAPAAETGKYQDGTYYGTVDVDPDTGWQTFAILTVEGGKITKADWDAFNTKTAGDLKKKYLKTANTVWLKRAAPKPNGMSRQLRQKLSSLRNKTLQP